MLVYLRNESAETVVRAATLKCRLQIKLAGSPRHSILTPGQPVLVPAVSRQASGRVASRKPISKCLVRLDRKKALRGKGRFDPGSATVGADA